MMKSTYKLIDKIMTIRGPYKVPSTSVVSYFLTVLDDYSWCGCIFLLAEKKEVAQTLNSVLL